MNEITHQNQPFYWAALFLRELQRNGMRHAVISPGSRSTPLTLAAASLSKLQKHVVLDERSAAFLALGIGKATNKPAALICTSGTAVANYYPAVIEARMSGVPLLLLTADRPPHLRGTGANQTIDQLNIFGSYPVFFHEVGEPVMQDKDIYSLENLAARSFHYSINRHGPVHLNFPFRKPLEPDKDFVEMVVREQAKSTENSSIKFTADHINSFRLDDDILYEIHASEKPLIIVGQLAAGTKIDHIFRLAKHLKAPVLCEQGIINPDYAVMGFESFLRSELNCNKLEPDLILRFGLQPASKSLLQALEYWNPSRYIYFSDIDKWSDLANATTDFIDWNGKNFDTNKFPQKRQKWLKQWKQIEESYFERSAQLFSNSQALTDGHIYHHLVPSIPKEWTVFISNSFPARDRSMFGQWKTQKIFTNRGASGIDGITSTAMGVNIGLNEPVILFTGDLAFLHDTNALLNSKLIEQPLVIIVINNRGGSLFRMLPIADHSEVFEPYFETPQQVDIPALAASYDIDCTLADSIEKLKQLDLSALVAASVSKLQIIECRTDPDASMDLRNKLWQMKL